MPAKKETTYLLVNRQTNPFVLPLYRDNDVVYEELEADENGRYVKVFKKRTEPKYAKSVTLPGSHYRELITNPTKTPIDEATMKALNADPAFTGMVKTGLIAVEVAPDGWEPDTEE